MDLLGARNLHLNETEAASDCASAAAAAKRSRPDVAKVLNLHVDPESLLDLHEHS